MLLYGSVRFFMFSCALTNTLVPVLLHRCIQREESRARVHENTNGVLVFEVVCFSVFSIGILFYSILSKKNFVYSCSCFKKYGCSNIFILLPDGGIVHVLLWVFSCIQ